MSRAEYEENLWSDFESGRIDETELEIGMSSFNVDTTMYFESEVY